MPSKREKTIGAVGTNRHESVLSQMFGIELNPSSNHRVRYGASLRIANTVYGMYTVNWHGSPLHFAL